MLHIAHNGLDVSQINPDLGQKYSPNLYQWLSDKSYKSRAWTSRIYRDQRGCLWIGILERRELIGAQLAGVLCNGNKEKSAAWQGIDAVEVPDFWERYTQQGRCAIDVDHQITFVDDETRWRLDGDMRECRWCGKFSQTLRRWTEQVQRQEWGRSEGDS